MKARFTAEDVHRIYLYCMKKIGGNDSEDLQWYLHKRPKLVTRSSFFAQLVWAVWVAGKSREATQSFLNRAALLGLRHDDYALLARQRPKLSSLLQAIHKRPVPPQARSRWLAIFQVAQELADIKDEGEFRASWFGGKVKSRFLDEADIDRLVARRIGWVGRANANFIVRNMGGEAVKCDRWVHEFLRIARMRLPDLLRILRLELRIPFGKFDSVLWSYCNREVKSTARLRTHLGPALGRTV